MKTLKKISLALAAASVATLTFAQDTNMPVQNNMPAQNLPERMLNRLTAQQFVTDAALGGMKEVRASELALEKSQNAGIKNFANRMIQDHSAANQKLSQIAEAKNFNLPATNTFAPEDPNWNNPQLTGSQQVKGAYLLTTNLPVSTYLDIKHLKSLSGQEFDEAYAKGMMSDHTATIEEFEMAQSTLTDQDFRQFVVTTLPTLRMHSQMVQKLVNDTMNTSTTSPTQYRNSGVQPQTPQSQLK